MKHYCLLNRPGDQRPWVIFGCILTACLFLSTLSPAQTAQEIAARSLEAVDFTAMQMTLTLTIMDGKGNERVRQIANDSKKFGETSKTLMRFLSPPDVKGTGILVYDYKDKPDDMWIYMPALRRTRRIVSAEKGRSFMGSEFSNADMSRPNLDDFTYVLKGEGKEDGMLCWIIDCTFRDQDMQNENGFSKKTLWVEKSTYLSHKVVYYDNKGELQKIMTLGDYRKQSNGRFMAFSMEIGNVQTGRQSTLAVNGLRMASDLDENSFTVANLEQP